MQDDLTPTSFTIEELQEQHNSCKEPHETCIQYYVEGELDTDPKIYMGSQGDGVSSQGTSTNRNGQSYIASVLSLPTMPSSSTYQRRHKQPAIDWSQSQVLTLDSNVMALEKAANLKESTAQAKEQRASERERKKATRAQERVAKAQK
jgi:hypothetical protein